jgi:hypothetical protein
MKKLVDILKIMLEAFSGEIPKELQKGIEQVMIQPSRFQWNGMCQVIAFMRMVNILTLDEYMMVKAYIKKHEPKKLWNTSAYWWQPGDYEPRIKWLKEHIKSLS